MQAADLGYKKTTKLALGDSSANIDVDEFVSKCLSFMRRDPGEEGSSIPTATQRRRSNRAANHDSDDEDTAMIELNWDSLGRQACIPFNSRPALSGFLLGPLSVQKKIRQQTQRRARMERVNPEDAVRPATLREEDLDKQENSNLTTICTNIRSLLKNTIDSRTNRFEEIMAGYPDPTDEEVQEAMAQCSICDSEGISLFEFCINPKSFGQTVENLFYVSFLIRDGSAGLAMDSNGLPTLRELHIQLRSTTTFTNILFVCTIVFQERLPLEEARSRKVQQRQAVFSIDFETWEQLTETFHLTNPIIPHRQEEEYDDGRVGWQ